MFSLDYSFRNNPFFVCLFIGDQGDEIQVMSLFRQEASEQQ